MLTGDKGDTAQQIGYSCGIFERDIQLVHKLDLIPDPEQTKDQISDLSNKITVKDGLMISGNLIN